VERIKQLYFSLSKQEIRHLKSYLGAFQNRGQNKSLELLELLDQFPDYTQHQLSEALYGDPQSKAFIMLKGRLLEKMLEALSLSVNLQNNPQVKEDPAGFAVIEIQKELTHAVLLRRRGLDELARELLEACVKRAGDLDLPELRLLALVYLHSFSTDKQAVGGSLFEDIHATLERYRTDILCSSAWDEFRVLESGRTGGEQQQLGFFSHRLPVLRERLDTYYSPRGEYFFLQMQLQEQQTRHDYAACRQTLAQLIALLESRPGLAHRNRLGIPYLQQADLALRTGHFDEAIQAAEQAREIFPARKKNYLQASLLQAFALIYAGRAPAAGTLLDSLDWFAEQAQHQLSAGLIAYLKACVLYVKGDYKRAMQMLARAEDLSQEDKEGWNAGIRIFEIQLLLDQQQQDLASARIETLRKHVSRYKVDVRSELIYRFLHLLERQSFHYQAIGAEGERLLCKMADEDPWTALSHEVIRFDVWLRGRQTGKPFYPLLQETLMLEAG
jgi:tetratricopeptide (TPR) repeat protein